MANFTVADLQDFVIYQDNETESLNSNSYIWAGWNRYRKKLKFTKETEENLQQKTFAGNFLSQGRLFERSVGNFKICLF
jgi:hypothetical protein